MPEDSPWVTVSRYLSPRRAERLGDLLRKAGVDVRIDPEGSTEENLRRVRVPLESAESAFEALSESVEEDHRWPPPQQPSRLGRLLRRVRGGRRPPDSVAEPALDVASALEYVRSDPSSPEARVFLARALLDAEDDKVGSVDRATRFGWARLALDEAIFLGYGQAASFELAELCLDEGAVDEAAAWIAEARSSGTDPPRVAYLECELAFHRGDAKALKNAVASYRRQLDSPDFNLVHSAALLFAAGEKAAAIRLADTALRDGEFASDEEWASAAALKVAMEGGDPEAVSDLGDVLGGENEAQEAVTEAKGELEALRSVWKDALKRTKKRGGDRLGGRKK